CARGAYFDLW
nr:immunoglobulin heavy chain junction region [Macaca mulatta]MOX02670.1 immunoglobulin heavy chain junction region [Macaca mulatta]MOX03826.1 immunoglobulin heavy chain junction region [Macaca mulatta]MOY24082.1 immunoglobulin heavy chain junction region [Macaca mulatta]